MVIELQASGLDDDDDDAYNSYGPFAFHDTSAAQPSVYHVKPTEADAKPVAPEAEADAEQVDLTFSELAETDVLADTSSSYATTSDDTASAIGGDSGSGSGSGIVADDDAFSRPVDDDAFSRQVDDDAFSQPVENDANVAPADHTLQLIEATYGSGSGSGSSSGDDDDAFSRPDDSHTITTGRDSDTFYGSAANSQDSYTHVSDNVGYYGDDTGAADDVATADDGYYSYDAIDVAASTDSYYADDVDSEVSSSFAYYTHDSTEDDDGAASTDAYYAGESEVSSSFAYTDDGAASTDAYYAGESEVSSSYDDDAFSRPVDDDENVAPVDDASTTASGAYYADESEQTYYTSDGANDDDGAAATDDDGAAATDGALDDDAFSRPVDDDGSDNTSAASTDAYYAGESEMSSSYAYTDDSAASTDAYDKDTTTNGGVYDGQRYQHVHTDDDATDDGAIDDDATDDGATDDGATDDDATDDDATDSNDGHGSVAEDAEYDTTISGTVAFAGFDADTFDTGFQAAFKIALAGALFVSTEAGSPSTIQRIESFKEDERLDVRDLPGLPSSPVTNIEVGYRVGGLSVEEATRAAVSEDALAHDSHTLAVDFAAAAGAAHLEIPAEFAIIGIGVVHVVEVTEDGVGGDGTREEQGHDYADEMEAKEMDEMEEEWKKGVADAVEGAESEEGEGYYADGDDDGDRDLDDDESAEDLTAGADATAAAAADADASPVVRDKVLASQMHTQGAIAEVAEMTDFSSDDVEAQLKALGLSVGGLLPNKVDSEAEDVGEEEDTSEAVEDEEDEEDEEGEEGEEGEEDEEGEEAVTGEEEDEEGEEAVTGEEEDRASAVAAAAAETAVYYYYYDEDTHTAFPTAQRSAKNAVEAEEVAAGESEVGETVAVTPEGDDDGADEQVDEDVAVEDEDNAVEDAMADEGGAAGVSSDLFEEIESGGGLASVDIDEEGVEKGVYRARRRRMLRGSRAIRAA
jgi:hypothetical protein